MIRWVVGLFIALAAQLPSFAQDLSGKWQGNYGSNPFTTKPEKVVVDLSFYHDTLVSGTSHIYYRRGGYEHYRVSGVLHKKDSSIYFKEDSVIGRKGGFGVSYVMCNYKMRLTKTDSSLLYQGTLRDNNTEFTLIPTTVWLEKPIPRKPKPKLKDKNLDRAMNVQSLIEIAEQEKDSIKVEIWDNAMIDGDVISVYENDSLIMHNRKLEADHIVFYISVDKSNSLCKLAMAAESQGSVPPCTAHMLVTTRLKKYELDLSSDSYKTGVLEFFLKE